MSVYMVTRSLKASPRAAPSVVPEAPPHAPSPAPRHVPAKCPPSRQPCPPWTLESSSPLCLLGVTGYPAPRPRQCWMASPTPLCLQALVPIAPIFFLIQEPFPCQARSPGSASKMLSAGRNSASLHMWKEPSAFI